MLHREVGKLTRRCVLWFVLSFCVATLQCCGSPLTRGETDGLEVSLAAPAGEDSTMFWYGVRTKALRITPDQGEPREIPWEAGSVAKADLREGDRLEFLGTDEAGRLLVTGEARVGEEKKITIALRRVL